MTPTTMQRNAIDLGSAIIEENLTDKLNITRDDIFIGSGVSASASAYHNNGKNLLGNIINQNISNNNNNISDIITNTNNFNYNNNNNNEINNLTATITSIRTNVTRVLYMYFQNVSDEFGYGAATTITSTSTTTSTTPKTLIKHMPSSSSALLSSSSMMANISPTTRTTLATALSASEINTSNLTATAATTKATINAANAINNAVTAVTKKLKSNLLQGADNLLNTLAATSTNEIDATTSSMTSTTTSASTSTATTSTLLPILNPSSSSINSFNASVSPSNVLTTAPSITYPSHQLTIRNYQNCSSLFTNYTQPHEGIFCNWTWDGFLCWPPTPAGVLARMHCPSGYHGINTKKFANRKCELEGHWGGRPNEIYNPAGWTDYQPCFKPEVNELMQMTNLDLYFDIAQRTRTLEIVGLIISLLALILSLIIFCNFRSLRNNRTKIHRNLFIAMIFQVNIRLTLYLDQAFGRGGRGAVAGMTAPGIENTPYVCESLYVLLEYARTAMFMWMFIEGLYLHNMVTVAVFQGRFPHTIFSLIGWGMPIIMTTIWALCTALYTDSVGDCWFNYNLTPYYWILEGPRLVVIFTNFGFLINIIRVLVVKLRQSQASDIEQTRKAVRAAIVLLPLLGITNLLYLVPDLKTPWKFALWSYVTHFLTSFQGFFIALIYCFLNGEVRAVLLKSVTVYMSVRGHPEWAPKRPSMFSGAYNTAPDTEAAMQDGRRNESPPNKRNCNGRKASTTSASAILTATQNNCRTHITTRLANGGDKLRRGSCQAERRRLSGNSNNNNNGRRRSSSSGGSGSGSSTNQTNGSLIWSLCLRGGQKNICVMSNKKLPTNLVMTTKLNTQANSKQSA